MPDISIRNVSDDVYAALKEKAASDGKSMEAWVRERLTMLSAQPTVKRRYVFKAYGENGAYITIRRELDMVQRGAKNCSQEQFDAFQKAAEYAQRNEIGDYEAAYKLLLQNFDEVFAS